MDPTIVLDSKNSAQFFVRQRYRNGTFSDVFGDEIREIVPATAGFENFLKAFTSLLDFFVGN